MIMRNDMPNIPCDQSSFNKENYYFISNENKAFRFKAKFCHISFNQNNFLQKIETHRIYETLANNKM